jgi:HAD superfamily hydrolase (TIGR01509 family)
VKKAHIFDMDGLLIDSEPAWRAAEIKVFTQLGIPFTEKMCLETVGMRIDEVVVYWQKDYPQLIDISRIAEDIQQEVIRLVKLNGKALPGVIETLQLLKDNNRMCALASSSNIIVIEAVLDSLKIRDYFKVIHSAQFEKHGKPSPDVFLTTAEKMGLQPIECNVYEDSRNGMKAGLAAGMKTILIPEHPNVNQGWFDAADLVLMSLENFDLEIMES